MRYFSYLNTAVHLLQYYKGAMPFDHYSKQYFKQYKKYGSKDRKHIAHLCYCYFRFGKSMPTASIEEKIKAALFLCSAASNELLANLAPAWNEKTTLPVEEKCKLVSKEFALTDISPWKDELSKEVEYDTFCSSLLIQPELFLRLRPGNASLVKQKLGKAGIVFKEINDSCISLPNATKLDAIIEMNKEAVVQDLNSQRIGEFLQYIHTSTALSVKDEALRPDSNRERSEPIQVWDCCAGSGGKSIMAFDIFKNIDLTVSDVRPAILANLKKRFTEAGIKKYQSLVMDLTHPHFDFGNSTFDIIIADVPCTGSGTWGRTPEQLTFFDTAEIDKYAKLQKTIVGTVIPYLQPGGHLLYCTCSVFKKENEEVVEFIQQRYKLRLQKMELLKGYNQKADTLFAALFTLHNA